MEFAKTHNGKKTAKYGSTYQYGRFDPLIAYIAVKRSIPDIPHAFNPQDSGLKSHCLLIEGPTPNLSFGLHSFEESDELEPAGGSGILFCVKVYTKAGNNTDIFDINKFDTQPVRKPPIPYVASSIICATMSAGFTGLVMKVIPSLVVQKNINFTSCFGQSAGQFANNAVRMGADLTKQQVGVAAGIAAVFGGGWLYRELRKEDAKNYSIEKMKEGQIESLCKYIQDTREAAELAIKEQPTV